MQLNYAFVFAYAKTRFSYDAAHLETGTNKQFFRIITSPSGYLSKINLHLKIFEKNLFLSTRCKYLLYAYMRTANVQIIPIKKFYSSYQL